MFETQLIGNRTPREFLEGMINDCFTAPSKPLREAADDYLAPNAVHHADGKEVQRDQHIAHLEFLQKHLKSMNFDLQQVAFDGEWLVERHLGRAEMHDGKVMESEVASFFHITNGKIDHSYEVTRPLSGVEKDREIHTAR